MKHINTVSLFTGAGALDYGFESAGFKTRVAIEFDSDCCSTLRANRRWPIIEKDIHDTSAKEILEAANLKEGEVDLILGGPPCQPFSKSAYWVNGDTRRMDDPRANTLFAYMRYVAELLPKVFVLENVHGISYSGKEEGFAVLDKLTAEINRVHGTNYQLSWKVINAADYGVPQLRKRFFLVANREGARFLFPSPTHGNPSQNDGSTSTLFPNTLQTYVTAWDAIGEIEDDISSEDLRAKGQWADLLPSIPEGENYLWHTNRKGGHSLFGWRTRYWSFLLKLAKDRPSWTIQAQPGPAIGPFHWANRLLSIKEMATLQTFPETIHFIGSRHSVQKQIGNAVPSLLSEILARTIAKQFFDRKNRKSPALAIKMKRPIPAPEPVQPVLDKYLSLIGDHPDHPGTGKGNSKSNHFEQRTSDSVSKGKRSEIMSRIRSTGTTPERELYDIVRKALGRRWRIERNVNTLPGSPDVYIPSLRLAIFADGCFFHSCPKHCRHPKSNQQYWHPKLIRNVERDISSRRKLRSLGYSVWKFWEHDFEPACIDSTYKKIEKRLAKRVSLIKAGVARA